MDFTQFNSLSKDVRTDIALCALVKILTGQMEKHLIVMERMDKDVDAFIFTYGTLINEIASSPTDVIEALRTLIEE